jgi:hypothetical protein
LVARWKKPTREERRAELRREQRLSESSGGTATISSISIQKWIYENVPLRFSPPRREEATDPTAFDYWWSRLSRNFATAVPVLMVRR